MFQVTGEQLKKFPRYSFASLGSEFAFKKKKKRGHLILEFKKLQKIPKKPQKNQNVVLHSR